MLSAIAGATAGRDAGALVRDLEGVGVAAATVQTAPTLLEDEHLAGDHLIVVARVHHLDKHHDGEPLLFYQGAYGRFDGPPGS